MFKKAYICTKHKDVYYNQYNDFHMIDFHRGEDLVELWQYAGKSLEGFNRFSQTKMIIDNTQYLQEVNLDMARLLYL